MTTVYTTDWSAQGRSDFATLITERIKELLESKHLYQGVTIEPPAADQRMKGLGEGNKHLYNLEVKRATESGWGLVEPPLPGIPSMQKFEHDRVYVSFPTIKIFCSRCDNLEAHNPSYAVDVAAQIAARRGNYLLPTSQQFIAVYTCQACKVMLQHFMVRREDLKLVLTGRSPIEHVVVPTVIPKSHRRYYSGAVVAFQSNQVLPALFMLRTFIEQFAASQVADESLRADAVLDAYMAGLPEPVRAHFPSPREIYSKLSEAIHSAREDADLFNSCCHQIVEHFEARRLYKVVTA